MSELSAQMVRDHIAQMKAIAEKGTRQAQEWAALNSKIAGGFSSGEITVKKLIERERQEIEDRLKQDEQDSEEKAKTKS